MRAGVPLIMLKAEQLALFGPTVAVPVKPHVRVTDHGIEQVTAHVRHVKAGVPKPEPPPKPAVPSTAWIDPLVELLHTGPIDRVKRKALEHWRKLWTEMMEDPPGGTPGTREAARFPDPSLTRQVASAAIMEETARSLKNRLRNEWSAEDEQNDPNLVGPGPRYGPAMVTEAKRGQNIVEGLTGVLYGRLFTEIWQDNDATPKIPHDERQRRYAAMREANREIGESADVRALIATLRRHVGPELTQFDGGEIMALQAGLRRIRLKHMLDAIENEGEEIERAIRTSRPKADEEHGDRMWNARAMARNVPPRSKARPTMPEAPVDVLIDILDHDRQGTGTPGRHWGEATPENRTARAVAGFANGWMRDKAKGLARVDLELTPADELRAHAWRKFAQARVKELNARGDGSRGRPLYRGLRLPSGALFDLTLAHERGETVNLPLVGVTAFSFDWAVAKKYTSSDWARTTASATHGEEVKTDPVVLVLKRSKKVDASIAYWHPDKSRDAAPDSPAFEVLSTLTDVKVTKITRGDGYGSATTIYLEAS